MNDIVSILSRYRILPVVVIDQEGQALPLADALYEGGLPLVEVTMRTKAASKAIRAITKHRPGITVGAGTLVRKEDIIEAMDAGALFGVAPGSNPAMIAFAKKKSFPFIPGVMTPGEIEAAFSSGIDVMKFFPAESAGGVPFLKSISAPFSHLGIKFIPTGGIKEQHLAPYLSLLSVLAVGGTWLAPREDIAGGNWKQITRCCREAVTIVSQSGNENTKE
jgi:2-dehydro-3-deoxyphosphogluconate aldolase/(4S)-4-hydroxy-2-oxoglutarate aldolase